MFNIDFNRDNRLLANIKLKDFLDENEFMINTIDMYNEFNEIDLVIFERIDYYYLLLFLNKYPNAKRILIPWEPEIVSKGHSIKNLKSLAKCFDYILTWNDDVVDNEKFFKINYSHSLVLYNSELPNSKEFDNRNLLVQVSSNLNSNHPKELYSLRKKLNHLAYERFENNYSFYGMRWKTKMESFKGVAQNKLKTISQFRFSFCLENMKDVNGYISEKIFDCFVAGVVPIYFGASNIENYIPKQCFIDYRNFKNSNDLFDFISLMEYEEWIAYLNNSREYLLSDKAYQFSINCYVDKINHFIRKGFNRNSISFSFMLYLHLRSFLQLQRKRLGYVKRFVMNLSKK